LLASLLYGVGPTDPLTFGLVIILLGVVAYLANYLPGTSRDESESDGCAEI